MASSTTRLSTSSKDRHSSATRQGNPFPLRNHTTANASSTIYPTATKCKPGSLQGDPILSVRRSWSTYENTCQRPDFDNAVSIAAIGVALPCHIARRPPPQPLASLACLPFRHWRLHMRRYGILQPVSGQWLLPEPPTPDRQPAGAS